MKTVSPGTDVWDTELTIWLIASLRVFEYTNLSHDRTTSSFIRVTVAASTS